MNETINGLFSLILRESIMSFIRKGKGLRTNIHHSPQNKNRVSRIGDHKIYSMFILMDYILTYWAQITLLLGILATPITYFTKRFYDSKDKKSEIKISLFQKQKVKSITVFLDIYGDLEIFYKTSITEDQLNRSTVNRNNFDVKFRSIMSKFQSAYNRLFIYLDENDLPPFELLYKAQDKSHTLITEYFNRNRIDQDFDVDEWRIRRLDNERDVRNEAEINLKTIGRRYLMDYN